MTINLLNCSLLRQKLELLRIVLKDRQIQLGMKALKKLIAVDVLTLLKEWLGFLGKLNFSSHFIPDYRR